MPLSNQQIRHLRGLAHHLHPVVTVAGKGLSETVLAELEAALTKHELVKVKLRADRKLRQSWIQQIGLQLRAEKIHAIGQVASFYRRNQDKPVIDLPGIQPSA